jgi:carbonic anhydrase/acetyltransferase-like protein (isoleucine patch superfamily)
MAFVEADIEKLCFVGEGLQVTRSERKHLETGAVGKVQGYKRECTEDSTCIYTHNNFILQKGQDM